MKVIFLDIDGVLNSDEYINKMKESNVKGIEKAVDAQKIRLLKRAIDETGAKVVLTSSWRLTKYLPHLKQLLLQNGVFLTDTTKFLENERGEEIKLWISENKDTEDFVILDDEIFDSYDENLINKLIKISNGNGKGLGEGLQKEDVKKIIQRLGRIKQLEEQDER